MTTDQIAWLKNPLLGLGNLGFSPPISTPTVPLPPDDVLSRNGDGGLFWKPNPDPLNTTAAPDDWVKGFLKYYDLLPPAGDGPASADACIFNSQPTTIDEVVGTLGEQAKLAGYKPNSNAKSIIEKTLATRGAGQKKGANLADDIKAGNQGALGKSLDDFEKMDMASLLDALEKLRDQRQLERVALMDLKSKPRLWVAILSVKHQLDGDWTRLMKQLPDPDKTAITHHVYGRMITEKEDEAEKNNKKQAQDCAGKVKQTLEQKGDLAPLRATLGKMDMPQMLKVLHQLKQNGTFEPFVESFSSNVPNRVGAAILTVRPDFTPAWQCVVSKLSSADQEAILEEAPADKQPDPSACGESGKKNVGWQPQVTGGLQYAGHWTIQNAKLTANNPSQDWTAQVQVGLNYAGHKDHASGPEFQVLGQIGYNISTGQLAVLGGFQGTLEKTIWVKGVETQLQLQLQALAGGIGDPSALSSVHGQFQAQIGVAYLVNLGPVWVGLQGSGGITLTQDSPMDFPGALTLGIQKSF